MKTSVAYGIADGPPHRRRSDRLPSKDRPRRSHRMSAIVVRQSVYGWCAWVFPLTADWEMWDRIAAHYPMWYEPATLAAYRVHSESATMALWRSGETLPDELRCIEISRSWLPPDRAKTISREAPRVGVSSVPFGNLSGRDGVRFGGEVNQQLAGPPKMHRLRHRRCIAPCRAHSLPAGPTVPSSGSRSAARDHPPKGHFLGRLY